MQLTAMNCNCVFDLRKLLREELEYLTNRKQIKADDNLLMRKEAARILKIDLSTLHLWTVSGKLTTHKIGRRIYYKRSENHLLQQP